MQLKQRHLKLLFVCLLSLRLKTSFHDDGHMKSNAAVQ